MVAAYFQGSGTNFVRVGKQFRPVVRRGLKKAVPLRQFRRPFPEDLAVGRLHLDVLEPPGHAQAGEADLASPAVGMRNLENALAVEEALDPLAPSLNVDIIPLVVRNSHCLA